MIVGLTGGIGCGKSTVAKLFAQYPMCITYDQDKIAHEGYYVPEIKNQLIGLLGEEAYSDDMTFNRKFVADKIFNDNALLWQVNNIFKPFVKWKLEQFIHSIPLPKIIIIETALLFEHSMQDTVDRIITVDAPEALRISRILLRNPEMTIEQIKKRMEVQYAQELKIRNSHYIIHNHSQGSLNSQVMAIYQDLYDNYHTIKKIEY